MGFCWKREFRNVAFRWLIFIGSSSKWGKIQCVLCFKPSLTRFGWVNVRLCGVMRERESERETEFWNWGISRFKATFSWDPNTPTADISCSRNPHTLRSQSQVYTAQDLCRAPGAACIYLSTVISHIVKTNSSSFKCDNPRRYLFKKKPDYLLYTSGFQPQLQFHLIRRVTLTWYT